MNLLRTKVPTIPTDKQNFNLTPLCTPVILLITQVPIVPTDMFTNYCPNVVADECNEGHSLLI